MAAARQMTAHRLNPVKGWPSPVAVDYHAPMSAAALAALDPDPVFAGRCGHLTNDLEFGLGVPSGGTTKIYMPIFFFHNSDDPDVNGPDGGVSGSSVTDDPEGWANVKRANQMGLVAAGSYELETSEYDTDDTYEPNHALQAATADEGVLSLGTVGTHAIVGIVSKGEHPVGQLPNSRNVLAFWPYCFPVLPA